MKLRVLFFCLFAAMVSWGQTDFNQSLGALNNGTSTTTKTYTAIDQLYLVGDGSFYNSGLGHGANNNGDYANWTNWDNQNNYFYYRVTVPTGYTVTINQINSNLRSSGTGPRAVQVQWAKNLSGPWMTVATSNFINDNQAAVNSSNNLGVILTEGETLYIRYKNSSSTSVNGGAVQSAGTHRINSGSLIGTYQAVSTDPTLTASPSSLTGLGYMEGGSSTAKTFSVSGVNLNPASGNISLTAPANFQVSTDNATFSNSLNLPYSGGTLAATNIYVRLNSNLSVETYSGNITIIGGGAANVTVSVEGIVTPVITGSCFSEDFSSITAGNNTATGGSSSEWDGNSNFPTIVKAFQAGGAVRLGTGSLTGSIESKPLNDVSGDLTVNIMVKGWTTVEGNLKVSIDGQEQTLSYTAKMVDSFEQVTAVFYGVTVGSELKIETTAKRAFIDNVEIICGEFPKYFISKQDGNWNASSTWQSSEDGINFDDSIYFPDANATSVRILNGNTVTISNSGVEITNTEVENGGSLEVIDNDFGLIGTGYALTIKDGGSFIVDGSGKPTTGTGLALVEAGGIFKAVSFSASNDFVSNYLLLNGTNNKFRFADQSVFSWEASGAYTLGSSGFNEIFWVLSPGDLVIYRMTNGFSGSEYGGGTNNLFHAVLEVNGNRDLELKGDGNKTFEGGIIGSGNLNVTYASGNGKLILGLNSGDARLGDSGSLNLTIPHNKLELKNVTVPAAASVTIESGDAGNPNTLARTGGNLNVNGLLDITNMRIVNTADGGININDGGTLRTSFNGGLYGTNVSSAISSGTLNLNNANTVEYYGDNQTISNLNYYHLKLSGTGVKTPQSTTSIHTNGSVTISGTTTVDYSGSNLASTAANNTSFTMDGGRLILGTTGPQPNMRGDYNVTGGVVEFANTNSTVQTIWNSPNYKYQNIEITGTNVGASSGNTALKPNGSFIVKTGGIYAVRQNAIKCYDSSPTGTAAGTGCSVVVEDGALFRTGNDKGFVGYESEVSSSSSAIDITITDITLEDGSTVEYLGDKSQEITKDELTVDGNHYYNLVVSGDLIEPVTGELKIANVLTLDEHDYNSNHFEGKLIIAETAEGAQPNVLYANKGVQINKGELILKNNAQLMQDADAVNTGNIFAQRRVSDINNDLQTDMDYIYWSSPVIGQDLHDFSEGTPVEPQHWGFLEYNEATDYFDNTHDDVFYQAKGYAIRAEDGEIPDPRIFEFTGVPKNGQISIDIEQTSEEKGFNLIGNPYPSNIYIDEFFSANSSHIHAKAFFWTNNGIYEQYQQGSGYEGNNYAVYTLTGGVPGTGGSEGPQKADPDGIVKVGQGFLVQAKQAGTVFFNNNHRDTDMGTFYSKGAKDRYWLTLTSPAGIVNTALVGYVEGATDGYDPDYDADYWGSSDGIYSLIPGRQLIIQGRQAPFNRKDKVRMGTHFYEEGVYIIRLRDFEGIFENVRILLYDKRLGIRHNLKKEPYKFFASAGEENERFEIIYNQGFGTSADHQIRLAVTLEDKDIRVFSNFEDLESVKVYNLSGRLIYSNSHVYSKELRIRQPSLQSEILIVHVLTTDGNRSVKKLVLP